MRRNRGNRYEILYLISMLIIIIFVTGYELKYIKTGLLIKDMVTQEIDYEAYRNFRIDEKLLQKTENRVEHLIRKEPGLQNIPYIDVIGYLTFSMMANFYDLIELELVDEKTFIRGFGKVAGTDHFLELYGYNKAILSDLEYFPVPELTNEEADIEYTDTWYKPRTYGGDRKHEGTDLMASNNIRGFFPVISITDGTVEKMGWLEQGGYRIGIRSVAGGYFYYAHLDSYAPELKLGDTVIAGQLLGFMGDSGYGSEGTTGQFDVHLHLGIYVNTDKGEMSINPYWLLRILEKKRTYYQNQ